MWNKVRIVLKWIAFAVTAFGGLYYLFGPAQDARIKEEKQSLQTYRNSKLSEMRAEIAKGPSIITHKTDYGEVLVIKIPKKPDYGTRVEYLECIVWRDKDFKRSSMSCPAQIDPNEIESALKLQSIE